MSAFAYHWLYWVLTFAGIVVVLAVAAGIQEYRIWKRGK